MVVVGMIEGFRSPIPLRLGMAYTELARRAADRVIIEIVRTNSLPSFLRRGCLPRLRLLGRLAAHLDQGAGLILVSGRAALAGDLLHRGARCAADHLGSEAPAGDDFHGEVDWDAHPALALIDPLGLAEDPVLVLPVLLQIPFRGGLETRQRRRR